MNTVSLLAFRSHLPLSDDFQILTCSLDPRSAFPNVSLKYTEKEHTNLKCIFCQTEFTIFCPSPFPFPSFLAQKICHLCQKPGRHYAFLPSPLPPHCSLKPFDTSPVCLASLHKGGLCWLRSTLFAQTPPIAA